jgi:hypothetical protein
MHQKIKKKFNFQTKQYFFAVNPVSDIFLSLHHFPVPCLVLGARQAHLQFSPGRPRLVAVVRTFDPQITSLVYLDHI